MLINQQFLEELERKIAELKRALRRKERLDKLGDKIMVNVPLIHKEIEYTLTSEDKDAIEQEATNKEQKLRDKLKEINKEPAKI